MAAAIFNRKNAKNDPEGPPPITAMRDPSVRENPVSSSSVRDEKESTTDVSVEFFIYTPEYFVHYSFTGFSMIIMQI